MSFLFNWVMFRFQSLIFVRVLLTQLLIVTTRPESPAIVIISNHQGSIHYSQAWHPALPFLGCFLFQMFLYPKSLSLFLIRKKISISILKAVTPKHLFLLKTLLSGGVVPQAMAMFLTTTSGDLGSLHSFFQ